MDLTTALSTGTLPDDYIIDVALLQKLGVAPSRAETVLNKLRENGRETFGNLLGLQTLHKAIEAVGGDESSGDTIWEKVQEVKTRRRQEQGSKFVREDF